MRLTSCFTFDASTEKKNKLLHHQFQQTENKVTKRKLVFTYYQQSSFFTIYVVCWVPAHLSVTKITLG